MVQNKDLCPASQTALIRVFLSSARRLIFAPKKNREFCKGFVEAGYTASRNFSLMKTFTSPRNHYAGGGRGGRPYKSDGDARRKIQIKPLWETNVGVA